jgi:hypothetical protein
MKDHRGGGRGIAALLPYLRRYTKLGGQRHPHPLYPRGWVEHRASVDGCGKSRLTPVLNPRTIQPVASRYTD